MQHRRQVAIFRLGPDGQGEGVADTILGEDAVIAGRPAQLGDHRLGLIQVELVELLDARIVEDVGRGDRAVEWAPQVRP